MNAEPAATIRLQQLMGRRVIDADGRRLGRVAECLAEADGGELRVIGLLVGSRAWSARFGSASTLGGRLVHWEEIAELAPHIVLRPREE